jgi:hypothetical protein
VTQRGIRLRARGEGRRSRDVEISKRCKIVEWLRELARGLFPANDAAGFVVSRALTAELRGVFRIEASCTNVRIHLLEETFGDQYESRRRRPAPT